VKKATPPKGWLFCFASYYGIFHQEVNLKMQIKPINSALLSYGMSGEVFHGPLLQANKEFLIKAVYQRNPSKKATHAHPVVHDIDSIWNDKEIELVVVNTPNETHASFAAEALRSGKHVVVEKPFTVSAVEADELIELAKRNNRILTVFQNRRWDGDFLTVKNVVRENLLGKIVEFEAHYDRFRNYIEANTWKEEAATGTGILYNLGSHMLDQVFVLFGMPEYIDARMGIQRPGGRVDDFYDIRLQYDGMNVIVKSSYLVRQPGPRYIIHGTEGSFVKYGLDPQEQSLKEKQVPGSKGWGTESNEFWGKLNTTLNGRHIEDKIETVPGNYSAFYQNLFKAIRLGEELAVQPEEARQVIKLIEAAIESNRSKRAVKLR
jgi:scyllo-inositol 2-dehydrogenase (NADP+)